MIEAVVIFPHQLFRAHPALHSGRKVILIEEFLFFHQFKFHRQKLVFHRASMRAYEKRLQENGIETYYIEATDASGDIRYWLPQWKQQGIGRIHFADVIDDWLEKRIQSAAKACGMECCVYDSPLFLNNRKDWTDYFSGKKRFFQTDFYTQQRKKRNILLDQNGNPEGGKWSFDADNRQRYPKGQTPPATEFPPSNGFVEEAIQYVSNNFPDNPGELPDLFTYPVDHTSAEKWMEDFFQHRFRDFGKYEDAIVSKEWLLHHSLLSPLMNVGLLSPQQVIHRALEIARSKEIPLNSLEGFIRQILGWREFIAGVYLQVGSKERKHHHFGFKRKLPAGWWRGETGILPVDTVIKRILKTGYCHHIERLMVLGNFMLLCEIDPDEVYRWFMEMFIDAYDWVMVPNVYGMSQFADGGIFATKPYIGGSNYLMKMGDFPKGDWQGIWDALFWRFMHVHRELFLRNPRMSMLVRSFDKMEAEKRNDLLKRADRFLISIDNGN